MSKECKHTRDFCRICERAGALTYPLIGGKWAPAHWPDRFIAFPGSSSAGSSSGFVEAKENKGKVTKAQRQMLDQLTERGLHAYVLRFHSDNGHVILYEIERSCGETLVSTHDVVVCVKALQKLMTE